MSQDGNLAGVPAEDLAFHFETGRLCLNFVSTMGDRAHLAFDRWRERTDLARWCVEAMLLPAAPGVSAEQLRQARDLREAIYRAIQSTRAVGKPKANDVRLLNEWAARPPLTPRLHERTGAVTWEAAEPLDAVLSTVARDAIDLLSGAEREKLKECDEPSCSVIFVDLSRPGRRRWCSMERCGNRAKKMAFRSRHGTRKDESA
jgi:predicted RNA-binding Zn ribbon-like protein